MINTNQSNYQRISDSQAPNCKAKKIFIENVLTLTAQNKEIGIQQLSLKMSRMTSLKMLKRTLLHGGPDPCKDFNP